MLSGSSGPCWLRVILCKVGMVIALVQVNGVSLAVGDEEGWAVRRPHRHNGHDEEASRRSGFHSPLDVKERDKTGPQWAGIQNDLQELSSNTGKPERLLATFISVGRFISSQGKKGSSDFEAILIWEWGWWLVKARWANFFFKEPKSNMFSFVGPRSLLQLVNSVMWHKTTKDNT